MSAAEAVAELARRRQLTPLAHAQLWDQPAPRTSQRRSLARIAAPELRLLLVGGGNRAGKSQLLAQWLVACAAGLAATVEDRPWVRAWLVRNALPETVLPGGPLAGPPATVWVGSETYAAACEQIRPQIAALCPAGTVYRSWDDRRAEGIALLPGGGKIVSKAYSGYTVHPQSWEGSAIRAVGFDEEPEADCVLAALSRLTDLDGRALIALTPLQGRGTSLYREIVSPAPAWFGETRLHGADNPRIPQEARRQIVATAAAWQRASRDRGEWSDPEGRILPWSPDHHLVDLPLPLPAQWPRFQGIDWGSRSPHILWATWDAVGDRIVVYREYAPRRTTTEPGISDGQLLAHAAELEALEAEELAAQDQPAPAVYRVADSEAPGAITEAAVRGWWIKPAPKGPGSIRAGLRSLEALLQTAHPLTGAPQRPRLVVVRGQCPQLQAEIQGLRWAAPRPGREPEPEPTCPDHGPDALRYLVDLWRTLGYS